MRVTIHQPEHLPWLGFFDKALRADLFVLLDTVQYRKHYVQNRNRIRTAAGWVWLTLSVRQPMRVPISEMRREWRTEARAAYLNLLTAHYRRAPFFERYFPQLRAIINASTERLAEVNVALIRLACEAFDLHTPMVLASTLDLPPLQGGTEVNLGICRRVGADTYFSGVSGREYLDVDRFLDCGVQVEFQEFRHPIYRQLHDPFLPCMSVVDLLFTQGPAGGAILRELHAERMTTVFT